MGGQNSVQYNGILNIEQQEIVKSHFNEISKIKDGSSGNYIGFKGMRTAFKPNKEFGQKLHEFLSSQRQDLKVNLPIFYDFVEFFLQDQNQLKNNQNYKHYTITELFCLISFFSEQVKNRTQDKEYVNRLVFSYRQGLQFFKELTLLFMKDQHLKFEDRNDAVPKVLNNLMFENNNQMLFEEFIIKLKQNLPETDYFIQQYFLKRFLTQINQNEVDFRFLKQYSELLNANTVSLINISHKEISEFSYCYNLFNSQVDGLDFGKISKLLQDNFQKYHLLILVRHLEDNYNNEDEFGLAKSRTNEQYGKERHVYGIKLPANQSACQSIFTILPNFKLFKNNTPSDNSFVVNQKEISFNYQGSQIQLQIGTNIGSDSFVRSQNKQLVPYNQKEGKLNVDLFEIWILNDVPTEMIFEQRYNESFGIVESRIRKHNQQQLTNRASE